MYQGQWSQREDVEVIRSLAFLKLLQKPIVLDIGCGTGLGYDLLHSWRPDLRYVGVDISEKMLQQCRADVLRVQGDMNDLNFVQDNAVDVVTLFYTTASYTPDLETLMIQINRILKKGGYAYVSVLSRPQILRLRRRVVNYRTRGDSTAQSIPAKTYSMRSLRRIGCNAGLSFVTHFGINTLSGRLEKRCLWRIGEITSKLAPQMSHTIAAVFLKKKGDVE